MADQTDVEARPPELPSQGDKPRPPEQPTQADPDLTNVTEKGRRPDEGKLLP